MISSVVKLAELWQSRSVGVGGHYTRAIKTQFQSPLFSNGVRQVAATVINMDFMALRRGTQFGSVKILTK